MEDHLATVVFLVQLREGRLNEATRHVKHQGQGGLFLGIVV